MREKEEEEEEGFSRLRRRRVLQRERTAHASAISYVHGILTVTPTLPRAWTTMTKQPHPSSFSLLPTDGSHALLSLSPRISCLPTLTPYLSFARLAPAHAIAHVPSPSHSPTLPVSFSRRLPVLRRLSLPPAASCCLPQSQQQSRLRSCVSKEG